MLSKILREKNHTIRERGHTGKHVCGVLRKSQISSVLMLTVHSIFEVVESVLFNWFLGTLSLFYLFFPSLITEITSWLRGVGCYHNLIK